MGPGIRCYEFPASLSRRVLSSLMPIQARCPVLFEGWGTRRRLELEAWVHIGINGKALFLGIQVLLNASGILFGPFIGLAVSHKVIVGQVG